MRHHILHTILATLLTISGTAAVMAPQEACATSVMALSDDQLVEMSDIVIHATIRKTEAIQYDDHVILTRVTVDVHEVFKGEASEGEYVFYTRGGVVGDYTQTIPGEYEARPGDEIVVFLEKIRRFDGMPMVLGLKQGAFIVKGEPVTRMDRRPSQHIFRQVEMPGNSDFMRSQDINELTAKIRQSIEARHD